MEPIAGRDGAGSPEPGGGPRRDEALAFIIERLVRSGASPTYEEIADALGVSYSRAKQLVQQLISAGIVEKTPGAQRNLRVRDVTYARQIIDRRLRALGWIAADPLGVLSGHCQQWQLPMMPEIRHLPDTD